MHEASNSLWLVFIGGAAGALLRYVLTTAAWKVLRVELWVGIMLVNILGCFIIAVLATGIAPNEGGSVPLADLQGGFSGENSQVTIQRGQLFFMSGML